MRWLIADSLCCPEQFFCSHLDSYSWYLEQAGEDVSRLCWGEDTDTGSYDVAFVLDRYDAGARIDARKRIAQVAAITNPLPWDVRKPDGSPAYDLVISSLRWMVDEARAKGCRAEFMPLAFDLRARACMMGVKRDLDCIFVGTTSGNHVRRTKLLEELRDVVTVLPPVYGREYFKTLARAKVVLNVHAEWARGEANNMRLYEGAGMGARVVSDGEYNGAWWWTRPPGGDWRGAIAAAIAVDGNETAQDSDFVIGQHAYESRIPRLIELARSP